MSECSGPNCTHPSHGHGNPRKGETPAQMLARGDLAAFELALLEIPMHARPTLERVPNRVPRSPEERAERQRRDAKRKQARVARRRNR